MSLLWLITCRKVGLRRTAAAYRKANLDRGSISRSKVLVDMLERRLARYTGFRDRHTSSHLPCVFLSLMPGENTLIHENVPSYTKEYKHS